MFVHAGPASGAVHSADAGDAVVVVVATAALVADTSGVDASLPPGPLTVPSLGDERQALLLVAAAVAAPASECAACPSATVADEAVVTEEVCKGPGETFKGAPAVDTVSVFVSTWPPRSRPDPLNKSPKVKLQPRVISQC